MGAYSAHDRERGSLKTDAAHQERLANAARVLMWISIFSAAVTLLASQAVHMARAPLTLQEPPAVDSRVATVSAAKVI